MPTSVDAGLVQAGRGQAVAEVEVVGGPVPGAALLAARGVDAGGVAEVGRAPRLVVGGPDLHPVAEALVDDHRVVGERLGGVAARASRRGPRGPGAGPSGRASRSARRRAPAPRRPAGRSSPGRGSRPRPVPVGHDPRPGDREAVPPGVQAGDQVEVLLVAVVGVAGHRAVPAVAGRRPGVAAKVSQIEGPRPSSVAAPSIWYAAVAAPKARVDPSGRCVVMGTTVVPRTRKWERSRDDQHQGRRARRGDVHRDGLARAARPAGRLRRRPGSGCMESARRLGYVPSPSAAGLASGQTRTVAVIVPLVTQWFFAAVVQGAEEVLRERGYDLLLYNLAGDAVGPAPGLRDQPADQARRRRPGAQPQAQPRRAGAARRTSAGRSRSSAPTCPAGRRSASTTSEAAAHRDPAPARPRPPAGSATSAARPRACSTSPRPSARLAGYRGTLERRRGCRTTRASRSDGEFTVAGGLRAGRRAARPRRTGPTAIFAASDEMAIGVLRAARELGLRVPEDVSVIGIDDHEMAELLRPDHGRPAGPRAGPGRGDARCSAAPRRRATGARSR